MLVYQMTLAVIYKAIIFSSAWVLVFPNEAPNKSPAYCQRYPEFLDSPAVTDIGSGNGFMPSPIDVLFPRKEFVSSRINSPFTLLGSVSAELVFAFLSHH